MKLVVFIALLTLSLVAGGVVEVKSNAGTPLEKRSCSDVMCLMLCPFGFKKDDKGCSYCECAEGIAVVGPVID